MAIANIFNVPADAAAFASWSFAHMAHHRDVNIFISKRFNIQLPEYPLDPVPLHSSAVWAQQHAAMHNAQDSLLGIPGYDLTNVDFQDKEAFAAWVQLNAELHYTESQVTGIG